MNTDIDVSGVGKRFEYLKHILEYFWNRWQHEYLSELREYQNCRNKVPLKQVLIHEKLPRNRWKIGVITARYIGKDGYIRGCNARVLTKAAKINYLNRPVNKLYPLEIQSKNGEISASENKGSEEGQ